MWFRMSLLRSKKFLLNQFIYGVSVEKNVFQSFDSTFFKFKQKKKEKKMNIWFALDSHAHLTDIWTFKKHFS